MLLCLDAFDTVLVVGDLQEVKAARVVEDLFCFPLDGPASENALTGTNQVLGRPPDVAQEPAGANTRAGLVLVALVGLEYVIDRFCKPSTKWRKLCPVILSYAVTPILYLLSVSLTCGINQPNKTLSISILPLNLASTSCWMVRSFSCQSFTAFSIMPFDLDDLTGDLIGTVSPTRSAETAFVKANLLGS